MAKQLSKSDMVAAALVAGIIIYYLWKKNQEAKKLQQPLPPVQQDPRQQLQPKIYPPDSSAGGQWFDDLPEGIKVQFVN